MVDKIIKQKMRCSALASEPRPLCEGTPSGWPLVEVNCLAAWGILVPIEPREPGVCVAKSCLVHWRCLFKPVGLLSNLQKLTIPLDPLVLLILVFFTEFFVMVSRKLMVALAALSLAVGSEAGVCRPRTTTVLSITTSDGATTASAIATTSVSTGTVSVTSSETSVVWSETSTSADTSESKTEMASKTASTTVSTTASTTEGTTSTTQGTTMTCTCYLAI